MKLIAALIILSASSGCMSHKLPPDAYMRGVTSKITTPWGSHELEIQEAGTGVAAEKAAGLK